MEAGKADIKLKLSINFLREIKRTAFYDFINFSKKTGWKEEKNILCLSRWVERKEDCFRQADETKKNMWKSQKSFMRVSEVVESLLNDVLFKENFHKLTDLAQLCENIIN